MLRRSEYMKAAHAELLAEWDDLYLWCNSIVALIPYEKGLSGFLTEEKEEYAVISDFANASKLLCLLMISKCQPTEPLTSTTPAHTH
jgi:hypothetical protein